MKNDPRPTERVIMPSIKKSQRQPAQPWTPSRWKMAKARREVTIPVTERVAQKKLFGLLVGLSSFYSRVTCLRRIGNSFDV